VGNGLGEVARAAAGGDKAAVERLLRELTPDVVRTARLIVGSGSCAAEDAAQDALVDIARGIGKLRDPEAVRVWALRVTTLRAYKVARRERILALRRAPAIDEELAIRPRDSDAAALKDAFDRLPPRMRGVAVLRLYAGLSEEDAARALGCSVGAVKSQLHEARSRLARTLRSQGVVPVTQQIHGVVP
jgi:RNA polymerase sigma-70 factor (ECF subfamily)